MEDDNISSTTQASHKGSCDITHWAWEAGSRAGRGRGLLERMKARARRGLKAESDPETRGEGETQRERDL